MIKVEKLFSKNNFIILNGFKLYIFNWNDYYILKYLMMKKIIGIRYIKLDLLERNLNTCKNNLKIFYLRDYELNLIPQIS